MVDETTNSVSNKRRSESKKQIGSGKGKPWTFPKYTLEDAIRIAKAIEEKNAGNLCQLNRLPQQLVIGS